MQRFTQNLILALLGAVTSAFTAAILVLIQLNWGLVIYGHLVWGIIPVGAFIAGLAAASGYYFGSRILNVRPGGDLLFGITAISTGTFFFIYWLRYVLMTVDGRQVRDVIGYRDFLTYAITHTALRFSLGGAVFDGSINIGAGGGYLFASLQILGFAFGGYAIYAYLTRLPYCEDCGLFYKGKGSQTRFFPDTNTMTASTKEFMAKVNTKRFQDSIQTHAATGTTKSSGQVMYRSSIEVKRCEGCEKHFLHFDVKRWVNNKNWKNVSEWNYSTYLMERVIVKT